MEALYFWLIGWVILSVLNFIYHVYGNNGAEYNKKVWAWRSFWIGGMSWIGIFFIFTFGVLAVCLWINDWVEEKLS